MINWVVLSGLPASGKTTWAERFKHTYHKLSSENLFCRIISVDDILRKGKLDLSKPNNYNTTDNFVILDGLFLTNRDIIDTLKQIPEKYVKSLTVVHWKEDRETCLINDEGRRLAPCTYSIETFPIEIPDAEMLSKELGHAVRVKFKKVKRYPVHTNMFGNITSPSETVSVNFDMGSVNPSIKALNDFLLEKYPWLTYKDFVELIQPLIKVNTKEIFDYYSENEMEYWFSINFKELMSVLEAEDPTITVIDDVLSKYYHSDEESYSYVRYDDNENEFWFVEEIKGAFKEKNLDAKVEFSYGMSRLGHDCDFASISWVYRGKLKSRNIVFKSN